MKKTISVFLFIFPFNFLSAQLWQPLGQGFTNNYVANFINYNSHLYASGPIANSGSTAVNGIAKWDGLNWFPLLNGAPFGSVTATQIFNGDLIAAGQFQNMNGVVGTKNIARWDGAQWHSLLMGVPFGKIKCMGIYNGSLYVGGDFWKVDTMFINDIARWDGTNWHPVCNLSAGLSQIESMAVFNNELYIGGYFGSINSVPISCIAKFDGSTWSQVGWFKFRCNDPF